MKLFVRSIILALIIVLMLFELLFLSGFFTVYDPAPGYYTTATSVAATNSWVDTAVAATMTAKVRQ